MLNRANRSYKRGSKFAAILAVFALPFLITQPAGASPITGEVAFIGYFEATGGSGPTDLLNATGINFTFGTVAAATGDFNATNGVVSFMSPVALNGFVFDPFFGPVDPLWAVGVFRFSLETLTSVDRGLNYLALAGMGTVSASKPGLDATAFKWSFSGDNSGGRLQLYSSTASPLPVAEPSELATLALLAMGMAAFAAWSRKHPKALLQ